MAGSMRKFADNKEYMAWNERMSRRFDPEQFYSCENGLVRRLEERRLYHIVNLLEYSPPERLLDVGCGSGKIEEILGQGRIVGMDISDYMLGKARERIDEVVKAQGEDMPFKDGCFDKAVCTEVLEHVVHPEKLLKEIARVLKKDGLAVISIPNEGLINMAKRAYSSVFFWRKKSSGPYIMPDRMDDHWHLHAFSLKLFKKIGKDIFWIDKIKCLPCVFFPLRYIVRCRPKNAHI